MPVGLNTHERFAVLRTAASSYVMSWDEDPDALRHVHWGVPLSDADITHLIGQATGRLRSMNADSHPRSADDEYPVRGGLRRDDSALAVAFHDGVRGLDLRVCDVSADGEVLRVRLADSHYGLEVQLRYEAVPDCDAIVRTATVRNTGAEPIRIDTASTATWGLPDRPGAWVTSLVGAYAVETQEQRAPLPVGRYALESRSGIPGHEQFPWIAVDFGAEEDVGEVWSVGLAWSGSFRICAHRKIGGSVAITAGINDHDLTHELPAGEDLELPPAVGIFTAGGHGASMRKWHSYVRSRVIPRPGEPRPVLYNSWEVTTFGIDRTNQLELADLAANIGCELFCLDDGWFTGRHDHLRALGDWSPDPLKFPHGIEEVASAARRRGMRFGLWVEPEAMSVDSTLFRSHPDWALCWPTREPVDRDGQRVLNYTRPDVREWAVETLDNLVSSLELDFIKWDYNRFIPAAYSPGMGGEVWIEQARGVASVVAEVRRRHPHLLVEACSSGGGRADLSSMTRSEWAWASDQTDPLDRLDIQRGLLRVLPPEAIACWVTDTPSVLSGRLTPLQYRFHVAMTGALGIGGDLRAWPEEDRALAASLVARYREVRETIHSGAVYRLPGADHELTGLAFVAPDARECVAFAFLRSSRRRAGWERIRLRGLNPDLEYRLDDGDEVYSGAALMGVGVAWNVWKAPDYSSRMIVARAVDSTAPTPLPARS